MLALDADELIVSGTLRSAGEVLDALDQHYGLHWLVRQARLEGDETTQVSTRAMKRVSQRLNLGLAITLCCAQNNASSVPLITRVDRSGPERPESMLLGTAKWPTLT